MTNIKVENGFAGTRFYINGAEISYNEFGPDAGTLSLSKDPGAANVTWIKENKPAIIEFIKETNAAIKAEEAATAAATVEFMTSGFEMHKVFVDTRKNLDEQFAQIAANYPNDCTAESVKADYERAIGVKAEHEAAAESKKIENLESNIETAEKSGRIHATQAEANEARRRYNNIHNEGAEGYVPRFYTQAEVDGWRQMLAELTASAEPKKYDKIRIMHHKQGERGGYAISLTKCGNIKVDTWSVYSDEPDAVYYIKQTADYNVDTDWDTEINDSGTTPTACLLRDIREKNIDIMRKVLS